MYVRTTMLKYTLYWRYINWRPDALATGIQAPAGPCKLMNIAIRINCIKYQMLHVSLIQYAPKKVYVPGSGPDRIRTRYGSNTKDGAAK